MNSLIPHIILGTLIGILLGIIPLVVGVKKEKLSLGIGGFFASALSGAILGLILAVPIAIIFTVLATLKSKASTDIEKRELAELIVIVLALVAFVLFTPGAAHEAYKIGSGLSYHKQLEAAGLTHQQSITTYGHELRVNKSKREGIIYAALMVNGLHLPLLGLLLVTTGIITRFNSRKGRKYLIIAFPLLCIWGIAFSGLAHRMISLYPRSLHATLMGSSLIWLAFAAFFAVAILIAAMIRRFTNLSGKKDR
jgi:hypothetical protein